MKILIVYYSLYGHVFKLAQAVKEGAESVKGAEVLFRRVEEFDIVLKKTADDKYLSQVREQQKDIPVCTLDDLRAADGVTWPLIVLLQFAHVGNVPPGDSSDL